MTREDPHMTSADYDCSLNHRDNLERTPDFDFKNGVGEKRYVLFQNDKGTPTYDVC